MSMSSKYTGQNISFSGCDMVVTIDSVFPDGTKFTRTIGSLQTMTYSIHMDKFPVRAVGNVNAKDYVFGPRTIAGSLIFAVFNKHFAYEMLETASKISDFEKYHFLMDELPPFNITVSFANEYGETSRMAIYGVRIVNEGQTMSVNDIYTENTYQFVATDIEYLNNNNSSSSEGIARTRADQIITAVRSTTPSSPIPVVPSVDRERSVSVNPSGSGVAIKTGGGLKAGQDRLRL